MKKIIYVTIAVAAVFLSCKKDDASDAAPRKPITRSDLYQENGYISGTIEGQNSTGTAFVKSFTHQLDGEMATYFVSENGSFVIHLNKLDKYGRIGDDDKETDLSFTLRKDKVTLQKLNDYHTSIYVDSSATSITKFNIDSDGTAKLTLSNIILNTSDETLTCDYVINASAPTTSSSREATVTGKISTRLTNVRYRTNSSL